MAREMTHAESAGKADPQGGSYSGQDADSVRAACCSVAGVRLCICDKLDTWRRGPAAVRGFLLKDFFWLRPFISDLRVSLTFGPNSRMTRFLNRPEAPSEKSQAAPNLIGG